MGLAERSGFDAQLSGSNLALDEAVRQRLAELAKRLPESVGLHVAPVIQIALSTMTGQASAIGRAVLEGGVLPAPAIATMSGAEGSRGMP